MDSPETQMGSSRPVLHRSIIEELTHLPAQPIAAVEVLRLVADPNASSAELGAVVDLDPALSARVLRLANAPHYGLGGTVTSAARAVVLLGFSTVKGVAAAASNGLLAEYVNFGPQDYWAHSVATAVAASVMAKQVGLPAADAFSVGLLHDLGAALLHRCDAELYQEVVATGRSALLDAERDAFGATHAEAGAAALQAWNLPPRLVRAVRDHHEPLESHTDALTKVVVAGEALADLVDDLGPSEPVCALDVALDALGVAARETAALVAQARREFDRTARLLGRSE